jgi:hypothetical protein
MNDLCAGSCLEENELKCNWAVLILISNWRRNVMNTTLSGARGERGGERKGWIERKVL